MAEEDPIDFSRAKTSLADLLRVILKDPDVALSFFRHKIVPLRLALFWQNSGSVFTLLLFESSELVFSSFIQG